MGLQQAFALVETSATAPTRDCCQGSHALDQISRPPSPPHLRFAHSWYGLRLSTLLLCLILLAQVAALPCSLPRSCRLSASSFWTIALSSPIAPPLRFCVTQQSRPRIRATPWCSCADHSKAYSILERLSTCIFLTFRPGVVHFTTLEQRSPPVALSECLGQHPLPLRQSTFSVTMP